MSESADAGAQDIVLPLRERMPEYLTVFGLGWVVVAVVGVTVGVFTSASLIEGVAFVALAYGVVLLLAGGASGGGYTSLGLGAAGAVLGGAHRHDEDFEDADVRRGRIKRVNPRERLRRGLRPEKNPRAFWQVVAGFAYLGGALLLLEIWG